jgi:hypothetical protein
MKPNKQNETVDRPKGVPPPVDIPEDNYDDYLEWTSEEEEAFLKILNEDKE